MCVKERPAHMFNAVGDVPCGTTCALTRLQAEKCLEFGSKGFRTEFVNLTNGDTRRTVDTRGRVIYH